MIPSAVREYGGRICVPQVFYQNQWVGGSELLTVNKNKLKNLKETNTVDNSNLMDVQPKPSSRPIITTEIKRVYRLKGQRDDDPWCIPEEYMKYLIDDGTSKPHFDTKSMDAIRSKAATVYDSFINK